MLITPELGEDRYENIELSIPALADGHKIQLYGIFLGREGFEVSRECI